MPQPFVPGDQVKIVRGAFEEMTGVVIQPEAPTLFICVEVRIFGRAVPVLLESNQIERLGGRSSGSPDVRV